MRGKLFNLGYNHQAKGKDKLKHKHSDNDKLYQMWGRELFNLGNDHQAH